MDKPIAITPPHLLSPEIAIAACRARGMGILDLSYSDRPALLTPALDRLASAVIERRTGPRFIREQDIYCLALLSGCKVQS